MNQNLVKEQNYTTGFTVSQTPAQVFVAINKVSEWWSGKPKVTGNTDQLGDEFTYQYNDIHYSRHKITESIPNQRVVWHTLESRINFVKEKSEWTGTDIIFEITPKGEQTELRFTHLGLVPAIQCYGDCSGAWGFYINESLYGLITAGKVPAVPWEV